jgi:hypothetical protein
MELLQVLMQWRFSIPDVDSLDSPTEALCIAVGLLS